MEIGSKKIKSSFLQLQNKHLIITPIKNLEIMKKVVLTAAIVLGGLSTFATPAMSMIQTDEIIIATQEEFKEIKAEELPQSVKDALAADFQTATLDKAYVSDKQEYKLEITVDGAASTVYADKDGNWIEKK